MSDAKSTKRIAVQSIDIDDELAVIRFTDDTSVVVVFSEKCLKENVNRIQPGDIAFLLYDEIISYRQEKNLFLIAIQTDDSKVIEINIKSERSE